MEDIFNRALYRNHFLIFERTENVLKRAKSIGGGGFDKITIQDVQDLWMEEEIGKADLLKMAFEIKEPILKKLREGLRLELS